MRNTIKVERIAWSEECTIGLMRLPTLGGDKVRCFTLEHSGAAPEGVQWTGTVQEGRIRGGMYPLWWWNEGAQAEKFQEMGFPGVLEIGQVEGYRDVFIQTGTSPGKKAGSIVLGMGIDLDGRDVRKSEQAVRDVYAAVQEIGGEWRIWVE